MDEFDKERQIAKIIAKEAGDVMLKFFEGDQQVETKDDRSVVTIADKLINTLVIERLGQAFPKDGVIGEEESTAGYGLGRKWFCDPIDGTAAYTWGVPTAMFSLALVIDGKPVMGVAYDPFLQKLYVGQTGKPSLCNDVPIHVSSLDLRSGTFGISSSPRSLTGTKYFQRMIDDQIRMACFSGAVYKSCLVARGKLVGYIEHGVNGHDVAAVQTIVEGAGGLVTSTTGAPLDYSQPFKGAIISNRITHDEILRYSS